jgi:hypothetical protein
VRSVMPRTDRMTPPPLIRGAYQIGWGGGCRSEGRRRGPERRVMTVAELWAVQAVSRVELGFRIWEGGGIHHRRGRRLNHRRWVGGGQDRRGGGQG